MLGVLLEPREGTRIGLRYSDSSDLALDGGDARNFRFSFTFPQNLDLSLFHQIPPDLALLADVAWTDWSDFSQNSIRAGPVDVTIDRRSHDTYRFGAGLQYRLRERLLLTSGLSYDSSPVDADKRTPDAPVSEQWRGSAGVQYDLRHRAADHDGANLDRSCIGGRVAHPAAHVWVQRQIFVA